MRSRWLDIDGPIHLAEYDGPADGPTFVLLHGLGGAHTNWLALAPLLAEHGRVVAPDLPGFGRSPLEGRSTTVPAALDFVGKLVEEIGAPVVLMGNSMGGLLSILHTAASPETVSGLVLIDPALPRRASETVDPVVARLFATYLIPRVGESFIHKRFVALGVERIAEETLRLCTVDPATVPEHVREAGLALARERADMAWATGAFLQAARSLVRTLARRRRVYAATSSVLAPTLMIAGAQDRLVPIAAAQHVARLRADWELVVLDHCGHVPMMEDAPRVAEEIGAWLKGPARRLLVGA